METGMKTIAKLGVLVTAAGFVMVGMAPAEAGRVGGRTGKGTMAAAGSAGGNSWARGRATTTNENGGKTVTSGGAFQGANGARGARASQTTVNADGSATSQSGFTASGARGSASSQGSATRNADGTFNGARTSTATSAATGNTYNGSTSYDQNGVNRTATCTDASGATIACPR
jgi:hypothetical protein